MKPYKTIVRVIVCSSSDLHTIDSKFSVKTTKQKLVGEVR